MYTIGLDVVFSLRPWSAQIPTGFPVSHSTWDTSRQILKFHIQGFHLLWRTFPCTSTISQSAILKSRNLLDNFRINENYQGFRLFPFRSPLLRESLRFLFLRLLRCFSSPGFAPNQLCIHWQASNHYIGKVPPFGNPRIKACLRLPEAYRSLPRPSSPHLT